MTTTTKSYVLTNVGKAPLIFRAGGIKISYESLHHRTYAPWMKVLAVKTQHAARQNFLTFKPLTAKINAPLLSNCPWQFCQETRYTEDIILQPKEYATIDVEMSGSTAGTAQVHRANLTIESNSVITATTVVPVEFTVRKYELVVIMLPQRQAVTARPNETTVRLFVMFNVFSDEIAVRHKNCTCTNTGACTIVSTHLDLVTRVPSCNHTLPMLGTKEINVTITAPTAIGMYQMEWDTEVVRPASLSHIETTWQGTIALTVETTVELLAPKKTSFRLRHPERIPRASTPFDLAVDLKDIYGNQIDAESEFLNLTIEINSTIRSSVMWCTSATCGKGYGVNDLHMRRRGGGGR
eukprot:SAG25_NODE_112_length_14924_cov_13.606476_14_plen_351_part_01